MCQGFKSDSVLYTIELFGDLGKFWQSAAIESGNTSGISWWFGTYEGVHIRFLFF